MKPKFSKEFNAQHARDGAPYCCRNGSEATVMKWDGRRKGEPLVGFRTDCDLPASWAEDGSYFTSGEEGPDDLVMLPVGEIDGKPVFVGDELVMDGRKKLIAGAKQRNFADMAWPAPAKIYLETLMTDGDLAKAFVSDPTPHQIDVMRKGANVALRHAIGAGQVTPISEATPYLRPHDPYTGRLRDPRDIESDPMGALIYHPQELMVEASSVVKGRRDERDMVIAQAMRDWYEQTFPYTGSAGVIKPNLEEIIAGVAP